MTGAASGIGRQLATDLWLREACHLRLVDVDEERLTALAAELRRAASASARTLSTHVVDVSSQEQVEALADDLDGAPLDVLVNCAGILCVGSFARVPVADFARVVEVNFLGAVRVTRALLHLLQASDRACIVNVASAAGLVAAPAMSSYTASKYALVGFSDALRAELHPRVAVCAVCPTLVRTELARSASYRGGSAQDHRERMAEAMQRFGATPQKVSLAIIRAVERGRELVPVNADAHLLYLAHRCFPELTRFLVRTGYRWLLRRGVLGE